MPEININGEKITFSESLKYLGLQLDNSLNFKEHVKNIRDKVIKTATTLAKIMPNKGGPKESTRRLINSVVHSQMLYAAPILQPAILKKNMTTQLLRPQRISALRVISGYRTISTSAALVLAGIPPIDLLIMEREEIWRKLSMDYNYRNNLNYKRLVKLEARNTLINRWQDRWNTDENGRWTYRLIPNIRCWLDRRHGEMNYYLTQILTGHGKFNSYLNRFKIIDSSNCDDCGETNDSAEHALFFCRKWNDDRAMLSEATGTILTPENIVNEMIRCNTTWNLYQNFIFRVMKHRCIRVTEPLISQEDGGVGYTQ